MGLHILVGNKPNLDLKEKIKLDLLKQVENSMDFGNTHTHTHTQNKAKKKNFLKN